MQSAIELGEAVGIDVTNMMVDQVLGLIDDFADGDTHKIMEIFGAAIGHMLLSIKQQNETAEPYFCCFATNGNGVDEPNVRTFAGDVISSMTDEDSFWELIKVDFERAQ